MLAKGKENNIPNGYITTNVKRATDLLSDMEWSHRQEMSEAQIKVVEECYALMMTLSRYDLKANNMGIKKVPVWNGEESTLLRHLKQFDAIADQIQDDTTRRTWLDASVRPQDAELFKHCTTYQEARQFLEEQAADEESVATTCENQLMGIAEASSDAQEMANLTLGIRLLGSARQAFKEYHMSRAKAHRVFRCTQIRKRENYIRDVQKLFEEQKVLQDTKNPNLAEAVYRLMVTNKNILADLHALMATDGRSSDAAIATSAGSFHAPKEGGGGGGKKNQKKTVEKNPLCPFCHECFHFPGQLYRCVELLMYTHRGQAFPPDMCLLCARYPRGDDCKAKTCCRGKNKKGFPKD